MSIYDQRGQHVETQFNINNFLTSPTGKRIPLFKPPQVPYFTDRENELKKLLVDMCPGKFVTLCGTGGMGKTALVAKAIWTLSPENQAPEQFPDGIIFHMFHNQPSVDVALEIIAQALGGEAKPTPASGAQRAVGR